MQETDLFAAFYLILASLLRQKRGAFFQLKSRLLKGNEVEDAEAKARMK